MFVIEKPCPIVLTRLRVIAAHSRVKKSVGAQQLGFNKCNKLLKLVEKLSCLNVRGVRPVDLSKSEFNLEENANLVVVRPNGSFPLPKSSQVM